MLSEGIDFAVRHGVGGWPELQAYRLLDDDLMPVCSPQLIAPRRTLTDASDLLQYPLLHDEHREDWALWCEAGWRRTSCGVGRCSLIPTA